MNRSFHTSAWRALVASSLLATAAMGHAQSAAPAPVPPVAPVAPATVAAPLGFQQLVDRVTALGYSDVREIERKSDKLYEVKARNAQGQRVELYVDARSGEVLREEVKR
jgi:hypothetical protein